MGELTCQLSPLVFAELYYLLLANGDLGGELGDRLGEIGCDLEWLEARAQDYDAKWCFDAPSLETANADDWALSVEHSKLATWLLAGLRNTGVSDELSSNLVDAVQRRMNNDAPQLDVRPQSLSPIIRGWTLGMAAGTLDPALPMLLAWYPTDQHISAAYKGLVEQVLHLHGIAEPWPELAGTALYVRTGGLAEALRPAPEPAPGERKRGLQYSIDLLMREAKPQAPLHVWDRLRGNWMDWVDRRNILTHVKPGEDSTSTFEDNAAQVRTWYEIHLTVLGITQFICQEVSLELQESVPPGLRNNDPWEYLQHDVKTSWD
ncbi:hypothetical protein O7607_30405 [Micromonospora sp. WMMA1949]|uniref:hypothetical protein n=1 Tax=Micromonospora sp. WMMA1949 TaxID=3015162 RepID=UPI0022B65729|nr:hypothetical protein [Micromonospora sp. WMMA1949]MCZ7424106.1 hypothetical protein [Micromonospora sp. WMMA1949]MCZ7430065.1 hypothetical protein [Micromonospora sp. WMMA1949]MCZ7430084.1 hypothetical protein [Micromonospora sp. WMMA1949]